MEATTCLDFIRGSTDVEDKAITKKKKKKTYQYCPLGTLVWYNIPQDFFFLDGPYSRKGKHSGKAVRVNLASTEKARTAAEVKPGSCARPV